MHPASILLLLAFAARPQAPHLVLNGGAEGDAFGAACAGAGDVNADGLADLIVGAWGADAAGEDSGAASVHSGADGSVLHAFLGTSAGAQLGWSVACANDLDGDGRDDLLVGAPGAHGDRGSSSVFSGAHGGVLRRWVGSQATCRHGTSVAGVGDWNGDGWPDLMVGEPQGAPATWSAYIFSGFDGKVLILYGGLGGLGMCVAGVGDLDGNGATDVVLGRFRDANNGPLAGMSWIHGQSLWKMQYGDDAGDNLGWSVDGAGDVDGDGVPDVVAGAPGDEPTGPGSGSLRVYSGADQSLLHTFLGAEPGAALGWSVAGAGDVNGDGHADVLAGAPFGSQLAARGGHARLFSGADGTILWSRDGESPRGELGYCVRGAGDLNADGLADWIVGEPGFGAGTGRALVFLGALDLGM